MVRLAQAEHGFVGNGLGIEVRQSSVVLGGVRRRHGVVRLGTGIEARFGAVWSGKQRSGAARRGLGFWAWFG